MKTQQNLFKILKLSLFSLGILSALTINTAKADKPSWNISFVLDQSGSMLVTDRSQYALLIPSVIADISDQYDQVTVIPQDNSTCQAVPCSRIIELRGNCERFKNELANLPDSSSFTKPLKTALLRHQGGKGYDQSIVSLVYDDQRQDKSEAQEIRQMVRQSGQDGYVFVMSNQTSFQDLFGKSNGKRVKNSTSLLKAYSEFFKKLLRAKKVPFGTSSPDRISVNITSGAKQSWIVIISNEDIREITQLNGNPSSTSIEISPSDTGYTFLPKTPPQDTLSYQLIRIDQPGSGEWSFQINTEASKVSWLLLSLYELPIEKIMVNGVEASGSSVNCPLGGCEIKVQLPPGQNKGIILNKADPSHIVRLTCDQKGECKGRYVPHGEGSQNIEIQVENDEAQNTKSLSLNIVKEPAKLSQCGSASFTYPVGTGHSLAYFSTMQKSADIPHAKIQTMQLKLGRQGQEFEPVSLNYKQATQSDLTQHPKLEVGDWIVTSVFTIGSTEPLTETIHFIRQYEGREDKCAAHIEFLPLVNLALTTDKDQHKLSACSGMATELGSGCSECGACQQSGFRLSYSGSTLSNDVEAQLSLSGDLPSGLTVIVGDQELESGDKITVQLKKDGDQTLPAAMCSNYCPGGDGSPQSLSFDLSVDRVFTPRSNKPERASDKTEVSIQVEPSSWFVCWLPTLWLALKSLLLLIFVFGFIKPLRFAKGPNGKIPYAFCSTESQWLKQIDDTQQFIRVEMPKTRWYRNDFAEFKQLGDSFGIIQSKALFKVQVTSKGTMLTCPHEESLYELDYLYNTDAFEYTLGESLEPNKPVRLSSSKIYYHAPTDLWIKFDF